jgi:DNA-binding beta-propeller fold protein YncE
MAVASVATFERYGDAAPAPMESPSGVVVMDDCDPDYEGKDNYEDNLSFFDSSGKLQTRLSGLNNCAEIGTPHRIAVDVKREFVWVSEVVGQRILQYDLAGKELLTIPKTKASALAVEPSTGNLWVCRSTGRIGHSSTEVFDLKGKQVVAYDHGGYDIAYDKKEAAFWMVEQEILKVSLKGEVQVRRKIAEWCAVSLAVNQKNGKVWVVKREGEKDQNELLGFSNKGEITLTVPLEKRNPTHVSVNQRDGTVWVTAAGQSVLRYAEDGALEVELKFPALAAEIDQKTEHVWIVTQEELLKIDKKGKVIVKVSHKNKTNIAWIATY